MMHNRNHFYLNSNLWKVRIIMFTLQIFDSCDENHMCNPHTKWWIKGLFLKMERHKVNLEKFNNRNFHMPSHQDRSKKRQFKFRSTLNHGVVRSRAHPPPWRSTDMFETSSEVQDYTPDHDASSRQRVQLQTSSEQGTSCPSDCPSAPAKQSKTYS
jgi:hypothetical protein